MTKILDIPLRQQIFIYGAFAHGLLLGAYILHNQLENTSKFIQKNIFYYIYSLGHLSIVITMAIRIIKTLEDTILPTIFGTLGHSLLLIFFTNTILSDRTSRDRHISWKITSNNYLNYICLFGQIGMIILYISEYYYFKFKKPLELIILNMTTVIGLMIFYILSSFKPEINPIISRGLLAVATLYLIFTIATYIEDIHPSIHSNISKSSI